MGAYSNIKHQVASSYIIHDMPSEVYLVWPQSTRWANYCFSDQSSTSAMTGTGKSGLQELSTATSGQHTIWTPRWLPTTSHLRRVVRWLSRKASGREISMGSTGYVPQPCRLAPPYQLSPTACIQCAVQQQGSNSCLLSRVARLRKSSGYVPKPIPTMKARKRYCGRSKTNTTPQYANALASDSQ